MGDREGQGEGRVHGWGLPGRSRLAFSIIIVPTLPQDTPRLSPHCSWWSDGLSEPPLCFQVWVTHIAVTLDVRSLPF